MRPKLARAFVATPIASLATDALRPAERSFLEKALESGRLQARLAELGASQASSTDIRSHAEQLKSDTRAMNEALTALRQRKAGAPAPSAEVAATEPEPDPYAELAGRAGAEFDREFVRVMSELHEATIALFEQTASEAKDADVRDLAAAQLPTLRAHRNRIVELKKTFE
jgi:putative membrane protein